MNLQTFKAPTMALAVAQVKATMGVDAVIVHTRAYKVRRLLGLLSADVVEVTAATKLAAAAAGNRRRRENGGGVGTSDAVAAQQQQLLLDDSIFGTRVPKPGGCTAISPNGSLSGSTLAGLTHHSGSTAGGRAPTLPTVKPQLPPPADPPRPGQALLGMPAAVTPMLMNVTQELGGLKELVQKVIAENRLSANPQVPDGLFDHYQNLIENDVARELALEIIRALPRELRPDQLARPECVRQRLAEHIERLVPACPPICRKPANGGVGGGPHVLALIGPTGVGKTTTLAKLAATLKLKDGHRVGMITLDTYRIAAVDQLRRYSEIIGAPLKVVASPDELRAAVDAYAHMDFVLVDTAGRSPKDAAQLDELRVLLDAINPDDVHLVLSSTSNQQTVELAYDRFSTVRVDKIIFTKLDEAAGVGVVLNVCHKVGKALSYVTTGQDVPNHIEVGHGSLLAKMILDKPYRGTGEAPVSAA